MAKRGLSKTEIKKPLICLWNIEFLHEQQRFKIWYLRDKNRELKKEIKELKLVVTEKQKMIDELKLQIEELRTMVFGKKNEGN
jgi:predicted RNase H-like nuclease (RuvC/YqgF family)